MCNPARQFALHSNNVFIPERDSETDDSGEALRRRPFVGAANPKVLEDAAPLALEVVEAVAHVLLRKELTPP